jgi:DNA ligase D
MAAARSSAGPPPVVVEAAGREVTVSNPDKVFFTARGETKLDLVRYYLAVEEPLMRALGDRPVLLERYPDGASGKSFFQKRVPASAPEWLTTTTVATVNGTKSQALVIADIAHVVWAVNLGCLGFHVWPSHASTPEVSDELRIDLDPMPGVTYEHVREAAAEVHTLCHEMGITAMPKTSGSRGIHVYARLEPDWDAYAVRAAAVALARELERRRPDLVTAAWWKEERGTRVFVDYNQNAPHKTVFGAWSVRPRVGAQVSTPVTWDQIATLDPQSLTMATVPAFVAEHGDAWATMTPQDLTPLLERSADDRAAGLLDAPWPPQYPKMPDEPSRVQPSRARRDVTGSDGPDRT